MAFLESFYHNNGFFRTSWDVNNRLLQSYEVFLIHAIDAICIILCRFDFLLLSKSLLLTKVPFYISLIPKGIFKIVKNTVVTTKKKSFCILQTNKWTNFWWRSVSVKYKFVVCLIAILLVNVVSKLASKNWLFTSLHTYE